MMTAVIEVVDIRKLNGDGNLKALADVKLADAVIIKGFSVMNGKNGLFVNMPRKVNKDGQWADTLTPTSDQIKRQIENKVMEAYDRELESV